MKKKLLSKTATTTCSLCKRSVSMRYNELHFFVDESDVPIQVNVDEVTNYGSCDIARNASIPGHPTHFEMERCPVYNELVRNR